MRDSELYGHVTKYCSTYYLDVKKFNRVVIDGFST